MTNTCSHRGNTSVDCLFKTIYLKAPPYRSRSGRHLPIVNARGRRVRHRTDDSVPAFLGSGSVLGVAMPTGCAHSHPSVALAQHPVLLAALPLFPRCSAWVEECSRVLRVPEKEMAQVAKQAARVGSTRKHRGREWVPRRSSVTGDAGLQDEWYTSNGVRISIPASNVSESARPQLVSMAEFLADDLRHLFDEQGIDRSKYAKNVSFEDPLTRYTDIDGYLTNISMLRRIFYPDFRLFSVVASGDTELTTRWRMLMDHLYSVPFVGGSVWKPRLAFSGISVMRFDPDTMQFTSHIDKYGHLKCCCISNFFY